MKRDSFEARAEKALADDHLHVALDRATQQLQSRREDAFSSLHEAEKTRDRARAAKLEALRSLDSNLEKFEARLQENGVLVHWALNGEEASRIVSKIARSCKAQKIIKSKSMVTEEIHLNEHLEGEGIEVVETDLGEYIVQLDRDRPSHIILPIIHKTKEDVGRLFESRLGLEFTDKPEELTRAARTKLRNTFLEADMGVSGANFGIIETGGLCLVSNEGNIRMVTSLPRVHVAILGIEKVIPTLEDLDRFLKILARSATGQKITVYTSLIHGPKKSDDDHGPDEVHVILLDNGRTDTLAGEQAEILACIRCGACLNACPVYKQIGGHAYGDTYPGPMGSVLTPTLRDKSEWHDLPQASSLCGACEEVCPVRIQIPKLLLSLRQEQVQRGESPWSHRLAFKAFALIATHPRLSRMLRGVSRRVFRCVASSGWIRRIPRIIPLVSKWTKSRDLKVPSATSFEIWFRNRKKPESGT